MAELLNFSPDRRSGSIAGHLSTPQGLELQLDLLSYLSYFCFMGVGSLVICRMVYASLHLLKGRDFLSYLP